jgi:hypothetical protein
MKSKRQIIVVVVVVVVVVTTLELKCKISFTNHFSGKCNIFGRLKRTSLKMSDFNKLTSAGKVTTFM